MEFKIYDKLLTLTLFQGLSRNDLTEIANKVRLEFRKIAAGNILAKQQARFEKLFFLLNGEIYAETVSDNHTYTIIESLSGNLMFEADAIFGLHPYHNHTYRAKTDIQVLCIDKQAIVNHLLHYEIVRFNLLNFVSTQAQKRIHLLRTDRPDTLVARFVEFINRRITYPAGEKKIKIRMEDLGIELGETRLTISRLLRSLQNKNLLRHERMGIIIPAYERLLLASKSAP